MTTLPVVEQQVFPKIRIVLVAVSQKLKNVVQPFSSERTPIHQRVRPWPIR